MLHPTVTISLPAFSGRAATCRAAHTLAPVEIPTKIPSSRANRRAQRNASSLLTVSTLSNKVVSKFAGTKPAPIDPKAPEIVAVEAEVGARISRLLGIDGHRTVDSFHRELGTLMWDYCGMERSDAGLRKALDRIPELRREFWSDVKVVGSAATLNQSLEKAGRVADFLELAELMCLDALHRTESCGGHFRAESQTEDGEARRDDDEFSYVASWEYTGQDQAPVLHKEDLVFDYVTPSQRSYK